MLLEFSEKYAKMCKFSNFVKVKHIIPSGVLNCSLKGMNMRYMANQIIQHSVCQPESRLQLFS